MTLVDTSIWIDHLRRADQTLSALLTAREVLCHPFIVGELALGNLQPREEVIEMLTLLPQAVIAKNADVLDMITQRNLFGLGIGYVDVHLLAAACLMPGTALWTRDKRLLAAAMREGLAMVVKH